MKNLFCIFCVLLCCSNANAAGVWGQSGGAAGTDTENTWTELQTFSGGIAVDDIAIDLNATESNLLWDTGVSFTTHAKQTVTKSTATTYTVGTTDPLEAYGGIIYVTSAATVTAPAIAAGMSFMVVSIGDIAVSLDVNSADTMTLDGTALSAGDKATNSSKSGDTIACSYMGANSLFCWSKTATGKWTDGN